MDYTTNLKLPLLVPNQAGKEIMHNEALVILDNIVQNGIISKDLSIPPENPNTNDIYIVGANATGTWEGKDNQLAFFDNGWRFIEPREGFTFWINDKDKLYCYNGTNWQEITSSDSSTTSKINELQNLSLCGINATANNENKLSVKSDYVLFDNNGNNSKIKVNKAIETDTASHLFQNNYSGRAEFGLIGDDNFTLKVSSDGEIWNNAFIVNKETGNIDFKGNVTMNGSYIGDNIIPSDNYVDIPTSTSGSVYIAPNNGYILAIGKSTSSVGSLCFENTKTLLSSRSNVYNNDNEIRVFLPCKIGDNIKIVHNINITIFRFIYAN